MKHIYEIVKTDNAVAVYAALILDLHKYKF